MRKHWIAILCIALTVFSAVGCKSRTGTLARDVQEINKALAPELPLEPVFLPVLFHDRDDGGLWLSYADYRALELNLIALKEYAALLEIAIRFYTQEE